MPPREFSIHVPESDLDDRSRRHWAEANYNIQHWTEMAQGGHFAALEQPEALLESIRTFYRGVR